MVTLNQIVLIIKFYKVIPRFIFYTYLFFTQEFNGKNYVIIYSIRQRRALAILVHIQTQYKTFTPRSIATIWRGFV
ncbi:hypothetical protein HA47_01550 [Pantoea stewartii subsp. indologenes]|nr:hypothetical protein HA47_01550 [Pantoea stewartii subsp. indologenes]